MNLHNRKIEQEKLYEIKQNNDKTFASYLQNFEKCMAEAELVSYHLIQINSMTNQLERSFLPSIQNAMVISATIIDLRRYNWAELTKALSVFANALARKKITSHMAGKKKVKNEETMAKRKEKSKGSMEETRAWDVFQISKN